MSTSKSILLYPFEIWARFFCRQPEVAARKLGINSSFIKGDYCYVLVRVSRFRETARLMKPIPANQMLHEEVSAKIQNMTPGNSTETIQFMTNFGTHYINSYVTGNSLYQVNHRWSSNYGHSYLNIWYATLNLWLIVHFIILFCEKKTHTHFRCLFIQNKITSISKIGWKREALPHYRDSTCTITLRLGMQSIWGKYARPAAMARSRHGHIANFDYRTTSSLT